jgi:predicted nucleic acid-binding protein
VFRVSRRFEIFSCRPVEDELSEAPERIRAKLLSFHSRARPLEPTRRVFELSASYVRAGLFPPDALIASFATAHRLDALVTVNRRHLKRPETARKIANVNRKFRLTALRILLPAELVEFFSQPDLL